MARLTPATRLRAQDDVLFQDLEGEGVLLKLETGIYFGLDRVGTRVWQLLPTHAVLADLVESLVAEFDVASDRCTADVLALAENMLEHGLVSAE